VAVQVNELFINLFDNVRLSTPIAPTVCSGDGCASYFFPGNLDSIQPWPSIFTNYSQADSVRVHHQQGLHFEFWSNGSVVLASSNDCKIWGGPYYAVQMCIAPLPGNHLIAGHIILEVTYNLGLKFCPPNRTDCISNLAWTAQSSEFSTSMAVSLRTSDTVFARSSRTILSVTNISPPTNANISLTDLFAALELVFGPDVSDNSSLLQDPFNCDQVVLNAYWFQFVVAFQNSDENIGLSPMRGMLALPVLLFQLNWMNPFFIVTPDQLEAGLPSELYVSVDLTRQVSRAVIPRWTIIVYSAMSLSMYIWCLVGMCAALGVIVPPTSAFEILDFACRVGAKPGNTLAELLAELDIRSDSKIREKLQNTALFVRETRPNNRVDT
jgi:hypothetical protein